MSGFRINRINSGQTPEQLMATVNRCMNSAAKLDRRMMLDQAVRNVLFPQWWEEGETVVHEMGWLHTQVVKEFGRLMFSRSKSFEMNYAQPAPNLSEGEPSNEQHKRGSGTSERPYVVTYEEAMEMLRRGEIEPGGWVRHQPPSHVWQKLVSLV